MAPLAIIPNDPLREFVLLVLLTSGSARFWCRGASQNFGSDCVVIIADLVSVVESLHPFKLKSVPKHSQNSLIVAFSL